GRFSKFLFYFYTPHCGPCRRMTPYVDELAEKHENIMKIDLSGNADIGHHFGVRAVPTILLIADGMVVKALVGGQSRQKLETLLLEPRKNS
ncbi:MAG: thioredoxin family protein, partial [Gammaproteobacteria bacterium]|nr:thioredoxin family protein [Gammaproteobacteria bacterium]